MNTRKNAFRLMSEMIKMIEPLKLQMTLAITLGVIGFLLSFGLGIFGGYACLSLLPLEFSNLPFGGHEYTYYTKLLIICAVLRGILHYIEQYTNHYIAFRILAEIRGKVFSAMRRLAPAKIEGENQGQLISMIMGDIELLEVFYAHTISPIMIAFITLLFLMVFYIKINIYVALLALASYLGIGVITPMIASSVSKDVGVQIRKKIGNLNGSFLDKLRGIKEVIQYDAGEMALEDIGRTTSDALKYQLKLKMQLAALVANTDTLIIIASVLQAALCFILVQNKVINEAQAFIAVLTQVSTFAPFIALANLGGTLTQTFACGDRILNLLAEEPVVERVEEGIDLEFGEIELEELGFAYEERQILKGLNLKINKGENLGIMGKSGSGKSTILKLLMRFWDPQSGRILINGQDLRGINTDSIYENIDYMTQTTVLFAGSLRDNMRVAKEDATDEEIYAALKRASIDEYVRGLKDGLDTRVSDLGDNFSGGERQRIGLARCFLTKSKVILLDEPTSNLDSHNEAIILKSIRDGMKEKTMVMVSHRESTMGACDRVVHMSDLN